MDKNDKSEYTKLTPEEERVMLYKGTEFPFTGEYDDFFKPGMYVCKRCNTPLYSAADKFRSGCGWPSFDDERENAVKRVPDPDGRRTEIICANCGAHLGHVFEGEGHTEKNVRHCVNSISLKFIPEENTGKGQTETAYFAGGCFWGVEHLLKSQKGVLSTETGFSGGNVPNPSYQDVVHHDTGHAETVKVVFDPSVIRYETLAKLFFEIHDPTQTGRQGPDVGDQYRSEVFYTSEEQKATLEKLIRILQEKGYDVTTQLTPFTVFYPAEEYHQHYYDKTGKAPYCHVYTKRF